MDRVVPSLPEAQARLKTEIDRACQEAETGGTGPVVIRGRRFDPIGPFFLGLPVLWSMTRSRLSRELDRFLRKGMGALDPRLVIRDVEMKFGWEDAKVKALRKPIPLGRSGLGIVGMIDVLFELDGEPVVYDYKTGIGRNYRADCWISQDGQVQVQLPAYLLAAKVLLREGEGLAGYLFVSKESGFAVTAPGSVVEDFLDDVPEAIEDLMACRFVAFGGAGAGKWQPDRDDRPSCGNCASPAICGLARQVFLRKARAFSETGVFKVRERNEGRE